MEIKEFINNNQSQIIDDLFSLLRIPSISSDKSHREDMTRCAEKWKDLLL